MIPILYENTETLFTSNGLGRLSNCIDCRVVEERNGVYEATFSYPQDGANFDLIQIGRIIGVTHDDTGDIQPFEIVGYSKNINGVVEFHAVHISYRLSGQVVWASSINSLAEALSLVGNVSGTPFTYATDKTNTGYMAAADGLPKSVREILGGIEGSILDTYGGEYEWDKWTVVLHTARGQYRDFTIRYGVNMLGYEEDFDCQGCYTSCVPYWTDGADVVIGSRVISGMTLPTGRTNAVPLDLSDKFESKPTKAQVEAAAASYINANQPYLPTQNITVEFFRLQDTPEYASFADLLQCRLCDTIKVVFPDYNGMGQYKIVKTEWNVLEGRYESMDLGSLSTSFSEALGLGSSENNLNGAGVKQTSFSYKVPALSAGAHGYWQIAHGLSISGTIVSIRAQSNNIAAGGGLQITPIFFGSTYCYIWYNAPAAISANDVEITFYVTYY